MPFVLLIGWFSAICRFLSSKDDVDKNLQITEDHSILSVYGFQ
jgi:hypothetical protein